MFGWPESRSQTHILYYSGSSVMLNNKKVFVVMPAYNAERTLEKTYNDLDLNIIDSIILVDDSSTDETVKIANKLQIQNYVHQENRGYGENQRTCYTKALDQGAEIVIMIHPDYQYEPKLAVSMAGMIASGVYDCVIASRIIGGGALKGGMPLYKYIANRFLTFVQNVLIRQKLSEYHTGYRAFSREVLLNLPLGENSSDFLFDNQMLAQITYFEYTLGEISCPTKYFPEASSINFIRSCKYGLGVLWTSCQVALQRLGIMKFSFLNKAGKKLV